MKVFEILKQDNISERFSTNLRGKNIEFKLCFNKERGYFWLDLNDSSKNHFDYTFLGLSCEKLSSSGWDIPDTKNRSYYYIDNNKVTEKDMTDDISYLPDLLNANLFSTKQKAEEVAREQKLYRLVKRFRDTNDKKDIDNENSKKFLITYNYKTKRFYTACDFNDTSYKALNVVYFSSFGLAERCIHEVVDPFYRDECK